MSRFYGILAMMGWAFAALVLVVVLLLAARMRARKTRARGFDVEMVQDDAKQH